MRITAGRLGGRTISSPLDDLVRPTSDKVRQAIFNVLAHNDFGAGFTLAGAKVIDLFAGTGALGIEALSRGGAFTLFVDNSAKSRALIRNNVETFALEAETRIWRRDATSLGPMPAGAGGPFQLAFLDPPYDQGLAERALKSLGDGAWLSKYAIVVVEGSREEELLFDRAFTRIDDRTYGDTRVRILRFE